MASGQIQTVLGPIAPSALGRTLTHEHIKMDYKCCLRLPWRESDAEKMTNSEFNLANLGWIHQNPYSHKFNMAIGDEPFEDIVAELNLFKQEGGQSIVEVTTVGIARDVEYLAKAASATGLNIIAGTGYYLDSTLPAEVKSSSVEELTKVSLLCNSNINIAPLCITSGENFYISSQKRPHLSLHLYNSYITVHLNFHTRLWCPKTRIPRAAILFANPMDQQLC